MSSMHNETRFSPAWQRGLVSLAVLVAAVLFLYRDTAIAMVMIWERSETFAHAFVVPPLALWLIWRQRAALLLQTPRPFPLALLAMAAACLAWLLGDLASVNSVTQLALIALLVLTVPTVLGLAVTRIILFPLGFLFFAAPVGEFLMPQMIEWTADFTVLALRLSGIPVFREGTQFVIPSGQWSVVEACSGIRYLIASLMVGTLFAYLNYRSTRRRWIFVGISILVPLVANWLRAYMIVMLGHFSGNTLAVGADHLVYGWVFFGIIMVLMFMIGSRWAEHPDDGAGGGETRPAPAEARAPSMFVGVAVAAVVTVALPILVGVGLQKTEIAGVPTLPSQANAAPDWQPSSKAFTDWLPVFQNPASTLNQSFSKGGQEVGLYIAYYRHQGHERKLVSSDNVLVRSNDTRWAQVAQGVQPVTLPGTELLVNRAELKGPRQDGKLDAQRLVVWQVYWVNGRLTQSAMWAKAWGGLYRLTGRGDDAAALIFYTEKDAAGEAPQVLSSFVRENLNLIETQLRATRGHD